MATKSIFLRGGLAIVWTALAAGCGRNGTPTPAAPPAVPAVLTGSPVVPPQPLHFQLPSGSSIEVSGNEEKEVAGKDGTLSISGGAKFNVSCRVPWNGELPKLWKVTFYWKVEGGKKESEIAGAIPKTVTREDGIAQFTCEPQMGKIPTTPDCRMKIQAYDGSRWSDIDVLEGITVVKR